jgi:hypothetical protein
LIGFFVLGLHQDDATAWAAQTLVGGGGHHVAREAPGWGIRRRRSSPRSGPCRPRRWRPTSFGHFGETRKVNGKL